MSTVSEVLNKLKENGYTVDFNLSDNCLVCHGNSLQVHPQEFVVDKYYRFEGASDPADEAIVYAISSPRHNLKGVLVNGYGISSNPMTDEMVAALMSTADASADNETSEPADAIPPRPSAERILNAELLEIDLNSSRKRIKEEAAWFDSDRNAITLFKSDSVRIVLIALHERAELKTHTAPGTISVQVLEGSITFETQGRTSSLGKGQMLVLHAGIPHSVLADQEAVFLLTISIEKGTG